MSEKRYKQFAGEVNADEAGTFKAVVNTLGVIDHDGDMIKKGALGEPKEVYLLYQHSYSDMPIGKGVIKEVGDSIEMEGQFFLNTGRGKEAYEVTKSAPQLSQFSVGFFSLKEGTQKVGDKRVNIIEDIDVIEVSKVLRGASPDTRLIGVKSTTPAPEPVKSCEHDYHISEQDWINLKTRLAVLEGKNG